MTTLQLDKQRGGTFPAYQYFYRKCQEKSILKLIYKIGLSISCFLYSVELCEKVQIGLGLYIGHPFGITINPRTVIGSNCNIHKGLTIGQENRGAKRYSSHREQGLDGR